jgi:hypothetical protein
MSKQQLEIYRLVNELYDFNIEQHIEDLLINKYKKLNIEDKGIIDMFFEYLNKIINQIYPIIE